MILHDTSGEYVFVVLNDDKYEQVTFYDLKDIPEDFKYEHVIKFLGNIPPPPHTLCPPTPPPRSLAAPPAPTRQTNPQINESARQPGRPPTCHAMGQLAGHSASQQTNRPTSRPTNQPSSRPASQPSSQRTSESAELLAFQHVSLSTNQPSSQPTDRGVRWAGGAHNGSDEVACADHDGA